MSKKLLYFEAPYLRCYPHHAVLWATLQQNKYDISNIVCNYIQIVYENSIERMDFTEGLSILSYIKNFPLFENYSYSRNVMDISSIDICKLVIRCIDDDQYVHLLVDTYYISAYNIWYNKKHVLHNITIYGYDSEQKIFYCADCFDNGIFTMEEVTFDEFSNAKVNNKDDYDWLEGIHSWKLRENVYMGMQYSIKRIKQGLTDFINSTAGNALVVYEERRRDVGEFAYGISTYEEVINYFNKLKNKNESIDIRIPYVLYEQIISLIYICKQLNKNSFINNYYSIIKELNELQSSFNIIINLCVKYNINRSEKKMRSIIERLSNNRQWHQEIAKQMLNSINYEYEDISIQGIIRNLKNKYELDLETKGNWYIKYGRDGYDIVGDQEKISDYIEEGSYKYKNPVYVSVLRHNADSRALSRVFNKEMRPIAYMLHNVEFSLEMRIVGDIKKKISLYFLDYDKLGREEILYVIDKDKNEIVEEVELSNFVDGVYVSVEIKGWIEFIIKRVSGPDAVLSGVFIDSIEE